MNDKKYFKIRYLILTGLIFIGYFLLPNLFKVKDYNIKISALPQSELLTIRQVQTIINKVTSNGHHQIENNAALLGLIRQAYQWDKNAMTGYAEYLDHIKWIDEKYDDKKHLDDFLKKYETQIVDKDGNQLKRPDIFDNTRLLYLKMAEAGYPWAALKESASIHPKGGFDTLSPDERKKKIIYLRSALNGGFHSAHVLIADAILISAGEDCSGPEFNKLNPLDEHRTGLSLADIQQALDEYKITALHGNSYGMLRLAESYHYGIGVKKNNNEAYLWGLMAISAFNEYQHREESDFLKYKSYIKHRERIINRATKNILSKIQQELTEKQQGELNSTVNSHMAEIITWDYYQWEYDIDPVPPKP
ncbi:TPA: sel1 repeat family protein [Salmonella enterica]|nr:sel1 repeat family protein [Salmonella enterica subsp. salamae serovar 40:c:e,n,x,z15]EIC8291295.1 sel1 repeat family protein [Salmonella enterica]EIU8983513.1 sel1 repeat family protein [Salmonella enterica]EJH2660985.1 sel1 repeat family protein [Salmonella enterica]ELO8296178.1 sel1 repeat family protein [Salmonella enterica]